MQVDECLSILVREQNMPAPPKPFGEMSEAEQTAHAFRVAVKYLDDHPESLPGIKERFVRLFGK